jgi:hypothetical protein
MPTTKKGTKEPTFEEWSELGDALDEYESARRQPSLIGLFPGLDDQEPSPSQRRANALNAIRNVPAYAWLTRQASFTAATTAFSKRISADEGEGITFVGMFVFYLLQVKRVAEHPESVPSKAERKRAYDIAMSLLGLLGSRKGWSQTSGASSDAAIASTVMTFAIEQKGLLSVRKPRDDDTAIGRQFVARLAVSMLRRFGKCEPSAIKPLGQFIGYDPDDRGWARLLADARKQRDMQLTKDAANSRVAHDALKAAMLRKHGG